MCPYALHVADESDQKSIEIYRNLGPLPAPISSPGDGAKALVYSMFTFIESNEIDIS